MVLRLIPKSAKMTNLFICEVVVCWFSKLFYKICQEVQLKYQKSDHVKLIKIDKLAENAQKCKVVYLYNPGQLQLTRLAVARQPAPRC